MVVSEFKARRAVLADSSPIQLQRLCSSISECVLQDGELIFSAQGDKEKYILCIVSSGVIIMGNMKCGPGKCILSDQIGADCVGKASGVSKVLTLPRESVLAVLGADGNAALLAAVGRGEKSSKKKSKSILDDSSGKKLGSFDTNDLLISDRTVSLGDFGYIGTTKNFDRRVSIKVYAKATLNESRLAEKIVAERNILAALRGKALCITDAVSSAQDERFIYLTLGDHFQCDLSTVLSETAISTDAKYYYAACAASAILALFDFGLFHRFINTSSLYITSSGVLKVADLRYARRMDGSRCLAVCGDPLYFAPEQVRQSGYDYAIDLWALGVLIYELFEGANPFGSEKTGETDIFKIISAFEPSILAFSEKSPDEVRDIIRLLMTEQDHKRLGYTDPGDLSRHSFFRANPLSSVGDKNKEGYPTDVACDVMDINPSDVPSFSSPIFEKF